MIPARIIQTSKTRTLSLLQQACTANARLLNPGFEWRLFDDTDVDEFVRREFPAHYGTFLSFRRPIQRFDFFRYLAVYRLGGFYLDLDVLLARGLSELQHHRGVFAFEGLTLSTYLRSLGMDWEVGNFAFGAAPENPFLEAVIDNCVRAQRDPAWTARMMAGVPRLARDAYEVLYSTGPGVLVRTLAEQSHEEGCVTVLFPDDVCDPRHWNRFGEYGVHLMEGSWRPAGGWLRRRLAARVESRAVERALGQSRALGPSRSWLRGDVRPATECIGGTA